VAFHRSGFSSKRVFIEAAFHQSGFSSKRLFIEAAFHRSGFSSKRLFIKAAFHRIPMGVAFHRTYLQGCHSSKKRPNVLAYSMNDTPLFYL
jgi:hypothetical protein